MRCNSNDACQTLGGSSFDAIAVASNITDKGSTNSVGRHGTSNIWQKWPKVGSKKGGITSRAPYNIGVPKTPVTLAGSTLHTVGLDLGPHGHGIGVVKAAIGGPHNRRTKTGTITIGNRGKVGGKLITPQKFCFRCAGTWLAAGVVVVIFLIVSGR